MNFLDIKYYLEGHGCVFDHYDDNSYLVTNQFTNSVCLVEDLEEYGDITICHYFFELKVSASPEYQVAYQVYCEMRKGMKDYPMPISKN